MFPSKEARATYMPLLALQRQSCSSVLVPVVELHLGFRWEVVSRMLLPSPNVDGGWSWRHSSVRRSIPITDHPIS